MTPITTARIELETMLGANALRDDVWQAVRHFECSTDVVIERVWDCAAYADNDFVRLVYVNTDDARAQDQERCQHATQVLRAELGDRMLASCAAAYLLHPQWWLATTNTSQDPTTFYRQWAWSRMRRAIAEQCVQACPPPDWFERLGQRLVDLVTMQQTDASAFGDTLDRLLACDRAASDPHVSALLDALTVGTWEEAWRSIVQIAGRVPNANAMALDRIKANWATQGAAYAPTLLARLAMEERLTMHLFRRVLEVLPNSLPTLHAWVRHCQADPSSATPPASPWQGHLANTAFLARLQQLLDDVLWELLSDFRPEAWPVLGRIGHLSGGRTLLRLVEEGDQRGLTRLVPPRYSFWYGNHDAPTTLAYLLKHLHRRPDDDGAALGSLLRCFPIPTLLAILPLARPYETEICAALGWDGSAALVCLLHQLESTDPTHSTDPAAGVVQRAAVLAIAERLGDEHTRTLLAAFAPHCPAAAMLAQAALGWNRTEVRRLFGRRRPLAARALALLPFEKGDTLLKRYLALTQFARDANTSPAGRKAPMRAAAQAGLTSLALHTGYADATRLAWAMQDQLGEEGVRLGRQWQIEGYTLTLLLRDHQPAVEVRNDVRVLKRTPSVVTRDYAYREVRDTLDQLKDQQRRYKDAFLTAMRRGDPLSGDELALLRRNPLAVALLERLVLRTHDGAWGLYRADDHALEGYYGERVRIDEPLYIAHPYDLAQADQLAQWQAEIVRRQLVQPFKQVFRELYVLTPAELLARYASSRVAGRRLKGRQATAVLANLGWSVNGGALTKPFYDGGFSATFHTGDAWYDEDDGSTTGALEFWPIQWQYDGTQRERRLPLADVPTLVFSEVMRDLDLVTVVAHGSDEQGSSKEVLQRRGELVRATAAALGLQQVTVDERHVFVDGSRARYRIALATAAIHIEGGAYLCIVPAGKQRNATYLPFEDGGDPVSSELISKMLLLANDAAISDPTILAQIAPPRLAA